MWCLLHGFSSQLSVTEGVDLGEWSEADACVRSGVAPAALGPRGALCRGREGGQSRGLPAASQEGVLTTSAAPALAPGSEQEAWPSAAALQAGGHLRGFCCPSDSPRGQPKAVPREPHPVTVPPAWRWRRSGRSAWWAGTGSEGVTGTRRGGPSI